MAVARTQTTLFWPILFPLACLIPSHHRRKVATNLPSSARRSGEQYAKAFSMCFQPKTSLLATIVVLFCGNQNVHFNQKGRELKLHYVRGPTNTPGWGLASCTYGEGLGQNVTLGTVAASLLLPVATSWFELFTCLCKRSLTITTYDFCYQKVAWLWPWPLTFYQLWMWLC